MEKKVSSDLNVQLTVIPGDINLNGAKYPY